MNVGGQKASKSAGVGTTVPQLLAAFDPDAIRYYLIANAPEIGRHRVHRRGLHPAQQRRAGGDLGQPGASHAVVPAALASTGRCPSTPPIPRSRSASQRRAQAVEAQLDGVHLRAALARGARAGALRQRVVRSAGAVAAGARGPRRGRRTRMGSLLDLINAAKVLFAPFLPHTSATLHGLLGYTDTLEAARLAASSPCRAVASCPRRGRCSRSSRRAGRSGRVIESAAGLTGNRPCRGRHARNARASLARRWRSCCSPTRALALRLRCALTPIWQNPDEPAHYNYVAFVAETGGLPGAAARAIGIRTLLERLKNGRLEPGDVDLRFATRPGSRRCSICWRRRCSASGRRTTRAHGAAAAAAVRRRARRADARAWPIWSPASCSPPGAGPRRAAGDGRRSDVHRGLGGDQRRPAGEPARRCHRCWLLARPARVRRMSTRARAGRSAWAWCIGPRGLLAKLALGIFVPLALVVLACARRGACATPSLAAGQLRASCVLPWLVHQVTTLRLAGPARRWPATPPVVVRPAALSGLQPRRTLGELPDHQLSQLLGSVRLDVHRRARDACTGCGGWSLLVALVGLVVESPAGCASPPGCWSLATVVVAAWSATSATTWRSSNSRGATCSPRWCRSPRCWWRAGRPGATPRCSRWGVGRWRLGAGGVNAYALLRVLVPGFAPTAG